MELFFTTSGPLEKIKQLEFLQTCHGMSFYHKVYRDLENETRLN